MKKLYRIVLLAILLLSNLSLWAQKADDFRAAANRGDKEAQYNLGVCYYNGYGVDQDYKQAVYWYTKAANQGFVKAQNNLGVCYKEGEGVAQDYKQAVYWYTKAANLGHAEAQYNLGVCYYNGYGVAQDYKQAIYWYTKASNQGMAMAQNTLGAMYLGGTEVAQDYKQAVYWLTKSASQGIASSQYGLGECYYNGWGTTTDFKQAVYWYTKAANQGYAAAQESLGDCYLQGKGVEKDYEQAFFWHSKAANQDNAWSQMRLGFLYFSGDGVIKDNEQAWYWANKAINNPEASDSAKVWAGIIIDMVEKEGGNSSKNNTSSSIQQMQHPSKSNNPTNNTSTSSTSISIYKGKYSRWPYYYSNPICGFRLGYVQRSLRVTGGDLDEPVHIDMFGEENDIIPGFQLGFLFDPSDWLNMGMFGLNMGVNFEMFFNKWDAAPSNHYDKYMEMNLNFPLDLTFHIPFSSESALYLHGGLAIDWGIYNRLTYSRNSNIEPLTDVFCKHWIDNLNLSYEYGVDLRMKAVMLSLNYQKGFYGHPVFENYSTTIDKLSLGLSFVF